jgi:hypothetical protein
MVGALLRGKKCAIFYYNSTFDIFLTFYKKRLARGRFVYLVLKYQQFTPAREFWGNNKSCSL